MQNLSYLTLTHTYIYIYIYIIYDDEFFNWLKGSEIESVLLFLAGNYAPLRVVAKDYCSRR